MPDLILFNILFAAAIVALVTALWFVMPSARGKKKETPDDALKVSGFFQTGLVHRFNTPMHRK